MVNNLISDHYYADIRGDRSPEIVVSRIPTSNATKMQQICQRLAQYANQRGPDWGSWQNKVALVAYEADTYKQCSNDIATEAVVETFLREGKCVAVLGASRNSPTYANNNQRFDGYVTTWTRNIMAGYTWWSNRPFAWYSKKR